MKIWSKTYKHNRKAAFISALFVFPLSLSTFSQLTSVVNSRYSLSDIQKFSSYNKLKINWQSSAVLKSLHNLPRQHYNFWPKNLLQRMVFSPHLFIWMPPNLIITQFGMHPILCYVIAGIFDIFLWFFTLCMPAANSHIITYIVIPFLNMGILNVTHKIVSALAPEQVQCKKTKVYLCCSQLIKALCVGLQYVTTHD